jgi:regulator of nucleoside diphosphate kinase
MTMPKIVISQQVLGRLDAMLGSTGYDHLGQLGSYLLGELARAQVVSDDALPPQVVSLHRKVRFRDDTSGRETEAVLAYPGEIGRLPHALSVLTPVGAALLGLSEGQTMAYRTPDGRRKSLTVVKVLP